MQGKSVYFDGNLRYCFRHRILPRHQSRRKSSIAGPFTVDNLQKSAYQAESLALKGIVSWCADQTDQQRSTALSKALRARGLEAISASLARTTLRVKIRASAVFPH